MKKVVVIVAMLLLPSCGGKRIDTSKEQREVKQKALVYSNDSSTLNLSDEEAAALVKEAIPKGLSRQDMIRLSLANSNNVQSDFSRLGIAKSDLVQAGLFTNPTLSTLFYCNPPSHKTCVDVAVAVTISDLWQVPIRTKIAQDDLAIATQKALQTVRDTVFEASTAYNRCIYNHARYNLVARILEEVKKLPDTILSQPKHDVEHTYNKSLAQALVLVWEQKMMAAENDMVVCQGEIKRSLSIPISTPHIVLTEKMRDISLSLPPLKELTDYALKNRPEMQIAHMKIAQARHALQLQRSKIWDNVQLGFAAVSNNTSITSSKPSHLLGVTVGLNVPLFDIKQGTLSRSTYLIDTAKTEYDALKVNIDADISLIYNTLLSRTEQYKLYPSIIETLRKSTENVFTLARQGDAPVLHVYQTLVLLYETELSALDLALQIAQGLAELEKAVSKQLYA